MAQPLRENKIDRDGTSGVQAVCLCNGIFVACHTVFGAPFHYKYFLQTDDSNMKVNIQKYLFNER